MSGWFALTLLLLLLLVSTSPVRSSTATATSSLGQPLSARHRRILRSIAQHQRSTGMLCEVHFEISPSPRSPSQSRPTLSVRTDGAVLLSHPLLPRRHRHRHRSDRTGGNSQCLPINSPAALRVAISSTLSPLLDERELVQVCVLHRDVNEKDKNERLGRRIAAQTDCHLVGVRGDRLLFFKPWRHNRATAAGTGSLTTMGSTTTGRIEMGSTSSDGSRGDSLCVSEILREELLSQSQSQWAWLDDDEFH
jgi:RNA-binding protein YhbY